MTTSSTTDEGPGNGAFVSSIPDPPNRARGDSGGPEPTLDALQHSQDSHEHERDRHDRSENHDQNEQKPEQTFVTTEVDIRSWAQIRTENGSGSGTGAGKTRWSRSTDRFSRQLPIALIPRFPIPIPIFKTHTRPHAEPCRRDATHTP